MPGAKKLAHQLLVVVDLAVLDDDDRSVLVRQGLVAAREVDDRQPSRREADAAVEERSIRIRPAVDERRAHRGEPLGMDGAVPTRDSADPAHAAPYCRHGVGKNVPHASCYGCPD